MQQNIDFFLVLAEVAPILFMQPARVSAGPRDRLPMSRGVFRANAEHAIQIKAPRLSAITIGWAGRFQYLPDPSGG